ncbi:unnamed protein product [Merluccius merluccius]
MLRPRSYLQNQFREASVASSSPRSAGIHRPAQVSSASRQGLSQGRYTPATSKSTQGNYKTIILHPRRLGLSAVQKTSRPNALPLGRLSLSTAIASGSAISNGQSTRAGRVHVFGDRRKAMFTRRGTGTLRTGNLQSPFRESFPFAVAPPTLQSTNYGQHSVSRFVSDVKESPRLFSEGSRAAAVGLTQSAPVPRRRVGAVHRTLYKLAKPHPPAYMAGVGPSQHQDLRSNYGRLPAVVKAYGKSPLTPRQAGTPKVSVYQSAGHAENVIAPPQRFTKAGMGKSGKRFAPTKIHNLPRRFGGSAIQRARDPTSRGVSQPQAT